jgi:hypothetical protein
VQVLYGSDVGFVRPLVEQKWQKLHEQTVDGLVRYLQNAK